MTASPSVQRLAAQIEELREQILAKRGPQLAYSSIEDGGVNEYDSEGNLTARFGKQFDGTHTAAALGGPPPPAPTAPTATPVVAGIKVGWDGIFVNDEIVPMDYARTEVHVGTAPPEPGHEAMFSTMRTTIETSRGGEVIVAIPEGEYYVWLITRSLSGKPSVASDIVGPVSPGKVSVSDLAFDPAEFGGGTAIHYGDVDPQTDQNITLKIGDLWLQVTDTTSNPPKTETKRWGGEGWTSLQDQGVSEALTQAAAAKMAADAKVRLFTQPDEPQGTSEAPLGVGDLWLDSDNGHRLSTWDGDSWEPRLLGNGSVQPQSLVASDVIATGTVTTSLLDAQAVTAEKIAAQAITAEKLAAEMILTSRLLTQDASGNTTFDLDGTTGNVTMVGRLATNLPGQPRLEVKRDEAGAEHVIAFHGLNETPGVDRTRIYAFDLYDPVWDVPVQALALESFTPYHYGQAWAGHDNAGMRVSTTNESDPLGPLPGMTYAELYLSTDGLWAMGKHSVKIGTGNPQATADASVQGSVTEWFTPSVAGGAAPSVETKISKFSTVNGLWQDERIVELHTYNGTTLYGLTVQNRLTAQRGIYMTLDEQLYDEWTPNTAYPEGVSHIAVSGPRAQAAGWGYAEGGIKYGTIRTFRYGSEVQQIWQRSGNPTTGHEMWVRHGNNNGWSSWYRMAIPGSNPAHYRPRSTGDAGGYTATSSASWTNVSGTVGVTFTAPPSGEVRIDIIAMLQGKGGTTGAVADLCVADFEVRSGGTIGSGTVVRSAGSSGEFGLVCNASSAWAKAGGAAWVSNLTPGAAYNARMLFRAHTSDGRNVGASNSRLSVTPTL